MASIVDIVPATDDDLLAGVAHLEDDFVLSVIGFDLAFTETDLISVREDLTVPVPRLAVLVLLKMVAWLDRPNERAKDLEDLLFIWDHALDAMDDRRWDPKHPVCAAALEYDDQSAFFVGWELGRVAKLQHLHWAKRFLDVLRDEDSVQFAQLVRAAPYAGDDIERQLRSRFTAFERGLELGATPTVRPRAARAPRPAVISFAPRFTWGASGALQMLIHDAIEHRRVIRFEYNGLPRIAAPHVLGIKDGRLQILTWQIGGASSSGALPNWRRFFVDELSNLAMTDESFAGPRLSRGKHSAFDRHIAVVRAF